MSTAADHAQGLSSRTGTFGSSDATEPQSGPVLHVVSQGDTRRQPLKPGARCFVGREPVEGEPCLVFERETKMSRRHAVIERDARGLQVLVTDLKSRNGTKVNGRRIVPGRSFPLRPGDRVSVGQILLLLSDAEPMPPEIVKNENIAMCPNMVISIGEKVCLISDGPLYEAFQILNKAAPSTASILLLGESGTGKEIAAKFIHRQSLQRLDRFVPINCAAVPESLFESEFFGHKKGAFTGALSDKPGLIRMANGGTLFLDEVGDLDPRGQAKLLRFLDDGTFLVVGSTSYETSDIRLIAATNKNLPSEIDKGNFRMDLYHRLSTVCVRLPSLREYPLGIPRLVKFFFDEFFHKNGRRFRFTDDLYTAAEQYHWPGNLRQLGKFAEWCNSLMDAEDIIDQGRFQEWRSTDDKRTDDHERRGVLKSELTSPEQLLTWRERNAVSDRDFLIQRLRISSSISEAARSLGLDRSYLRSQLMPSLGIGDPQPYLKQKGISRKTTLSSSEEADE